MQSPLKIILGIDPGTIATGYGIIEIRGNAMQMREMGILKFSAKDDPYVRLGAIFSKVSALISHHEPQAFAIEAPFFGKNVQSMLKLGRAQGVAIAAAMQAGLEVFEYSPRKIKQSVTGNGNADKAQVLKMLQTILKFEELPKAMDASDALACAVCHHLQASSAVPISSGSVSWEAFAAANPGRVR